MGKRTLSLLTAAAVMAGLTSCSLLEDTSRTFTVMLPDGAGLFVGNDVGVLGIPVGTVTALVPAGSVVQATIEIRDSNLRLPADVGAAIVPRSIAADRYLEMTPVYEGGPTLDDGATIPVERTVVPVDFDRVLSSLKGVVDDLTANPHATADLGELVDVSARALKGKGQDIHQATESLAAAVAEVNGQRNTVVGTVESLTGLTKTLNANEGTVRAFIENVADAVELLSDERLNVGASLTSLSASVDDIARLAHQNRRAMSHDIRQLTKVLRGTARSQQDLEAALDNLPLTGQNLQQAIGEGRLRTQLDPLALTPLAPFLDKLCTSLGPLCDPIDALTDLPALLNLLGLRSGGTR